MTLYSARNGSPDRPASSSRTRIPRTTPCNPDSIEEYLQSVISRNRIGDPRLDMAAISAQSAIAKLMRQCGHP